MKIVYFITILALALAFTTVRAKGQNPSDSLKIIYKGKTIVVKQQGEESSSTVRFIDTATKRKVLVRTYFTKDDEASAEAEDMDTTATKLINMIKGHQIHKDKRRFIRTSFLPTFDIGFASTINDMETARTFTPKFGKSVNIDLGLIRQDLNLYNGQFLFSYGLNLNRYYLKYGNKQMLQYIDNNGFLASRTDSVNHYDKNRLDIGYLAVPVMLEYHSKKGHFEMAAGVEFGFNATSKLTLKGSNESGSFKQKNETDIKVNPNQMNAVVRIGINNVALYAKYSITNMYKSSAYEQGADPGQHLCSVGLCILGI